jgi:DNA-binding transcriptional LysR family regulator
MVMYMPALRDVEIRHLLALRAVAQEGTFGRAASQLGFSQAAISQQIAGLERALGEPVFDRPGGPRPVELTPAGRLMLEHADAIVSRLDAAAADLDRLRTGAGGRLLVGTFQSVSVKLLPTVISALRAESPALDIRLHETDDNEELAERLLDDALDLAFVVGPLDHARWDSVLLCRDPFVVIVAAASPLGQDGLFPLAQLDRGPLVGQQECACQALIDDGLRGAGVEPTYVFRSNDNGAVQAMVRAGMGAAVLPLLAIDADDPGIRVARLVPDLEPREILLAWRLGRTRPPAAQRFIELARESCRAF